MNPHRTLRTGPLYPLSYKGERFAFLFYHFYRNSCVYALQLMFTLRMARKLLVTGGCGFIGSNFISYWFSRYPKDSITNLDALTYAGHLSSTAHFADNKNYHFIKGSILNKRVVERAMKDVDIVVHFAAESHVDRSIKNPTLFLETNVLGTQVLLESALRNKIKRFHHISTDEVYGALEFNTGEKFSEETSYRPRSPYAASKAASDHLVQSYAHTFGLPTTITNCSNNFGPFQDPEKFIPRLITNCIEDRKVMLYGDGLNVRDWLHVEDHCRAIDLVITKGSINNTYCIGGQVDEVSNLEVATRVLNYFNKSTDQIAFVTDRLGHDRRYAVNWTKIRTELGWKPRYQFDEWLTATIKWYEENTAWWRPLKERAEKLYR